MTNKWIQTTQEGREWKRRYDREHYQEQKPVRSARSFLRRRNKRAWLLVDAARRRARLDVIAYDLDGRQADLQRRIDAGFCELTGIPFNLDGGRTYDSPSLDRINPKKGYIYDNIRVICDLMNRALSDWGEGPVRIVAEAYMSSLRKRRSSSELI